jgi:tetratricopeptide (TPR) repeat protein
MNEKARVLVSAASALLLVASAAACGSPPPPNAPASDPLAEPTPAATGSAPAAVSDAEFAKAETAITAGDFAGGKTAAEAILAKDPKNGKALYYKGAAAEGLGDKATAEAAYKSAAAAGVPEAAVNLSALYLDGGKIDEAIATLQAALKKTPSDTLLQANLGAALAQKGDKAGALAAYEKADQKGAGLAITLGHAEALSALDRKPEATTVLKAAAAGDLSRDELGALAKALARVGAFADAVATIDKAIAKKSGADVLTYRGLFKRSLKDLAGAKTDFEAAGKEDAAFAPARLYLGEVLEELKKPADAKKAYEEAAKLGGETPPGKKAKEHLEKLKKK